jgi:hypothetical protein
MLVLVWARALLVAGVLLAEPMLQPRSEQIAPITYNQGLARVDGGWVLSGTRTPLVDTDVLVRTDDDLNILVTRQKPIPEPYRAQGYNHVGDGDVVDGIFYVPFEQPNYGAGHQVTARYDATTLAFIDAVEVPQHENSFVTVDAVTMIAYSMDHFDGDTLQRYDVAKGWAPLEPLKLSMVLHHTQGADVADGVVWISTSDAHNDVYRADIQTGATTNAGTLGHQGAEGEGFDATPTRSGAFHGMINDLQHRQVELIHYDLAEVQPVASSSAASESDSTTTRRLVVAGLAVVVFAGGIGIGIRLWRLRRTPS